MYVTPAIARAPTGPQPSSNAAIAPGAAFSTRSSTPAIHERFSPVVSSDAEYSRPSSRSSSTTPISLAMCVNSWMPCNGTKPPTPKARPPMR